MQVSYSGELTDAQGTLIPGCFVGTAWRSMDYGENDGKLPGGNIVTKEKDEDDLDWLTTVFDAVHQTMTKTVLKFKYNYGPDVPLCGQPMPKGPPEGVKVGQIDNVRFRIDPPLGPETEAFFIDILQNLQTLPPGIMSFSPFSLADLNQDTKVDIKDFSIFRDAFGSCAGQARYNGAADLDADDCVTFKDYQIWFQLSQE